MIQVIDVKFFESGLSLERARPESAEALSALALRSKCYWPYPLDYLVKCMDALRISTEDIEKWPVFTARHANETIGFFMLKEIDGEPRLDHLWVDPRFIGKGLGRWLFAKAIEEAGRLEWRAFRIAADPFAERFYSKLGARRIGEIQSRIKPDLFLPHLEYRLN
jgi:GNAT superfamily N-acetyltransferase